MSARLSVTGSQLAGRGPGCAAFAHGSDPSVAWHAPVGSALLYWSVTAVLILAVGGAVGFGWWLWRARDRQASADPTLVEGLADRRQVRAAAGAKSLSRRAATLRSSMDRPAPSDLGYYLGAAKGVGCWASVEDSIFVLGPPRSGKGSTWSSPAPRRSRAR